MATIPRYFRSTKRNQNGPTCSSTPLAKSNGMTDEEVDDKIRTTNLSDWGLYPSVEQNYRGKGIHYIHEWQAEALNQPGVTKGKNLVFAAPTSAGKTLVADILILRHAFSTFKKKVLVILPFVSLVREKMMNLQSVLEGTHVQVGGFMSTYHTKGGFDAADIAICTVEKANSYVLKLLEQDKLDCIGMMVIDEIHLINDPSRGYRLELLLTKVMTVAKQKDINIQIVGMSADIPNLEDLSRWLEAVPFRSNARPVPLVERVAFETRVKGAKIFRICKKVINEQQDIMMMEENVTSENPIITYAMAAVKQEKEAENGYPSLLIFYNNKVKLQGLAERLAMIVKKDVKDNRLNQEAIDELIVSLQNCSNPADKKLIEVVRSGIGFHHADLLTEHKDMIEDAFRAGVIRVLVCTSTLSSGVNLPAKRVIVRSPVFFGQMMDIMSYRQMIGRAGRLGFHCEGESLLMCDETEREVGEKLFLSSVPEIRTQLLLSSGQRTNISETFFPENLLLSCIMEAIVTGIASTRDELNSFLGNTFFYCQSSEEERQLLQSQSDAALSFMVKLGLLEASDEEINSQNIPELLKASPITSGIVFAGMDPNSGIAKTQEVSNMLNKIALGGDLGLLFFIIQDNAVNSLNQLPAGRLFDWFNDWTQEQERQQNKKVKLLSQKKDSRLSVAEMIGVTGYKLQKYCHVNYGHLSDKVTKKYYLSLALEEVINENSVNEVSSKYGIPSGTLQSLQTNAASFANMVSTLCEYCGFNLFKAAFSDLVSRLEYGVSKELVELMQLPSMSPKLARRLFKAGFMHPKMLANLSDESTSKLRNAIEAEFKLQKIKVMELRNRQTGKQQLMKPSEIIPILKEEAEIWCLEEVRSLLPQNRETTESQNLSIQRLNSSVFISPTNTSENTQTNGDSPLKNQKETASLDDDPIPRDSFTLNDTLLNETNVDEGDISSWIQSPLPTPEVSINTEERRLLWISPSKSKNKKMKIGIPLEERLKKVHAVTKKRGTIQQIEVTTSSGLQDLIHEWEFWGIASLFPVISQGKISNKEHANDVNKFFINSKDQVLEAIYLCFGNLVVYSLSDVKLLQEFGVLLNQFLKGRARDFTLVVYDLNPVYIVLHKCLGVDRKVLFETIKWIDIKLRRWYHSLQDPQMFDEYVDDDPLGNVFSIFQRVCQDYQPLIQAEELKSQKEATEKLIALTYLLFPLHTSSFWNQNYVDIINFIETPAALVFADIQSIGMTVSHDRLKDLQKQVSAIFSSLKTTANQLTANKNGIHREIDLESIDSIRNVIYNHMQLYTLVDMNDEIVSAPNAKSVKKARLQLFSKYHPLPQIIMDYRILQHNYINSIVAIAEALQDSIDGRIYGQVESWTATGRISMSHPPLMMTPKPFSVSSQTINIRGIFVPKDDWIFLSSDYSQFELRILAHFSEDELLLDILNSGGDVFRSLVAIVFSKNHAKVSDDERQRVKRFTYAVIYGMQTASDFEEETKTDEFSVDDPDYQDRREKQDFQWFKKTFMDTFPGIERFRLKVEQDCQERGYVESIAGRRRYLPLINHEKMAVASKAKRQSLNTMIQGTAADLMKLAMIRLHEAMLSRNMEHRVRLVHTMHDELIFEVEPLVLRDFAKLVVQVMSGVRNIPKTPLLVELPVNLKTGRDWSSLSSFNEL
jgi:replicative superfamily II helicase/DNA polymerase I-like protein with 3'-5' exonuclease and polymerase domains